MGLSFSPKSRPPCLDSYADSSGLPSLSVSRSIAAESGRAGGAHPSDHHPPRFAAAESARPGGASKCCLYRCPNARPHRTPDPWRDSCASKRRDAGQAYGAGPCWVKSFLIVFVPKHSSGTTHSSATAYLSTSRALPVLTSGVDLTPVCRFRKSYYVFSGPGAQAAPFVLSSSFASSPPNPARPL